jgi:hypothetical protein
MRKLVVTKVENTEDCEGTSLIGDCDTDLQTTTQFTYDDFFTNTDDLAQQAGGFKSVSRSTFKKPVGGTYQDNITREEILEKLEGYIPLRTIQEKRVLTKLPTYKTMVRYINEKTKKFRNGGLLSKVVYPEYIMLANPALNLVWSVQLKDSIIFIKDPRVAKKPLVVTKM